MTERAVLFDLDETLLDRAASLAILTEEMLEAFGNSLEGSDLEAAVRVMQKADRGVYRERQEAFGQVLDEVPWDAPPEIEDLIAFWTAMFPKCSVPMKGAFEVLRDLRDREIPIGLITNGGIEFQNAKIDRVDLRDWLDVVIVSEAAGMEKPDPRIFHLALSEMSLEAKDAAFVGDHPVNDVSGAAEVGMTSVWINGREPWPEALAPPDHTIVELGELIPALDGLPLVRG
jgi:putative hydrolase of the HAD superfamily